MEEGNTVDILWYDCLTDWMSRAVRAGGRSDASTVGYDVSKKRGGGGDESRYLEDDVECMDDSWDVAEDCEEDVD